MPPVVREEIGSLVTGLDQFRMGVQKNGGLYFPRVHIAEQRGLYSGPFPRGVPVLHGREKRHPRTAARGFLNHIAQYVVSAVSVDQHQRVDAGPAERIGDVPDHRVERDGRDADGPRPRGVLVRAGDRHRRKEMDRIRGGDLPRDGTRDERVRRERQERTVLFEASDRKHGDLP